MILNLGSGNETYGDVRADFVTTEQTTITFDLDKPFPLEDNSFEEVYCNSVLEHIKNLEIFVDEIYRVMKPNGKLFIRTDNAGYLPFHLFKSHEHNQFLNGHYDYRSKEDNHYHLFVESHLRKLFSKFKNIEINYVRGGGNWFNKLLLGCLGKMGCLHIELRAVKEPTEIHSQEQEPKSKGENMSNQERRNRLE